MVFISDTGASTEAERAERQNNKLKPRQEIPERRAEQEQEVNGYRSCDKTTTGWGGVYFV